MDFILKIFLMTIDFVLTRKTVIEFISCPAKLMNSSFPVRGHPFAVSIFCSNTASSIVSNVAVNTVYQVAVAYQVVFLCRCLCFLVLFTLAFFTCSWWDITVQDFPSSDPCPSVSDSPLRYDVFISFRGPDTRYGFTSHLFDALGRSRVKAFMDHRLEKGEEIAPGLSDVIERSKISIVVLSENYASSSWCLDELVKIMGCRASRGQIVLPVFYGVKPTDVRRQTGSYGLAFEMYQNAPEEQEKIEGWRDALSQVANLFGYDSDVVRSEAKLVKAIVDDVLKIQGNPGLIRYFPQQQKLSGTQQQVKGLGKACQGTQLAQGSADLYMQIVIPNKYDCVGEIVGSDGEGPQLSDHEIVTLLLCRMQHLEELREKDRRVQEEQAAQLLCLMEKCIVFENLLRIISGNL